MAWDTDEAYNWLANDETAYVYVMELARDLDTDEDKVGGLAEMLEREIPQSGYVQSSVDWEEVDWEEIAEAFLAE